MVRLALHRQMWRDLPEVSGKRRPRSAAGCILVLGRLQTFAADPGPTELKATRSHDCCGVFRDLAINAAARGILSSRSTS